MNRIIGIAFILLLMQAKTLAQTEGKGIDLSGTNTYASANHLLSDSMTLHIAPQFITPPKMSGPSYGYHNSLVETTKQGGVGFQLWKGASVGIVGSNYHLPGLMDTSSGMLSLNQDIGRWHFSVSGSAHKYWMPWQRSLFTQYGMGGTVGYDISSVVSLHAFGYYYANQMQVGPAMSPYVNNSTYGGYADIRFSKTFGTNLGVRRYVNPMNGKWTTEPIVTPHIKIGDSKLELPLGGLLKAFFDSRRESPMQFRPHPFSRPASNK